MPTAIRVLVCNGERYDRPPHTAIAEVGVLKACEEEGMELLDQAKSTRWAVLDAPIGRSERPFAIQGQPAPSAAKLFAVMFAGRCLPMGSNGAGRCQGRSTKRRGRMGPAVFSVRRST